MPGILVPRITSRTISAPTNGNGNISLERKLIPSSRAHSGSSSSIHGTGGERSLFTNRTAERERERERVRETVVSSSVVAESVHCAARHAVPGEPPEGDARQRRSEESALFMAILILKWYLMSHRQIQRQIYPMGPAGSPRPGLERLAIVVRIHTCVLVRPCCQRHSYRTRSTNDGVELPDGTPRGVRDLYPVWLPRVPRALPARRALALPSSPKLPRFLSVRPSRRNCRETRTRQRTLASELPLR